MSTLVVVVLCTYNPDQDLFERQFNSLKNQTLGNFICIICDDSSALEHQLFINQIISNDSRFVLFRRPSNIGVTANFQQGIIEALRLSPSYIALCDQDDYWDPMKLEKQLDFLRSTNSEIVSCDLEIANSDFSIIRSSLRRVPRSEGFIELLAANDIPGASIFMTSKFASLAIPFPESSTRLYHDHWLALLGAYKQVLKIDGRVLYKFIQHGGNNSGDRRADKWDSFSSLRKFILSPTAMTAFLAEREAYLQGIKERFHLRNNLISINERGILSVMFCKKYPADRKLGYFYLFLNNLLKFSPTNGKRIDE